MQLAANLGFLFTELALPDAIRAAAKQGFDAVEMHWPYHVEATAIAAALTETGLPLLGINTIRGNAAAGEFGLCALPGRETEARASIDQAIAWAVTAGARNIHVMSGKTSGPAAMDTFATNLAYAAERAEPHGIGLLIEPINQRDVPGYFTSNIATAREAIAHCAGKARLMFDCYHQQVISGDLLRSVEANLDIIGHIQIAAAPDRAEPDHGEVDYAWLLPAISATGYTGAIGAEYKPATKDFGWMRFVPR